MATFHDAGEFIGANIEFFSIFSLIDFSDSDMGAMHRLIKVMALN